jgi:hypothetical protein
LGGRTEESRLEDPEPVARRFSADLRRLPVERVDVVGLGRTQGRLGVCRTLGESRRVRRDAGLEGQRRSPAEIRHDYVRANPKRRKVVLSASKLAIFEAWQLSLWYQELALLYLLDRNGEYRNRMTA